METSSTADTKLQSLKRMRGNINGSVTRMITFVQGYSDPEVTEILRVKLEQLSQLCETFDKIQLEIELLSGIAEEDESPERVQFEERYHNLKADIQQKLRKMEEKGASVASVVQNPVKECTLHTPRAKLPALKINIFNGAYTDWPSFKDLFVSMIHNDNLLQTVHKFMYLKMYLKDEALAIVDNIAVSSENYAIAWKSLCDRYDRSQLIINAHMGNLHSLPLIKHDSMLKDFVIKIKQIRSALQNFNVDVNNYQFVYVVIQKLNERLRRDYEVQKIGNDGEIPKLDELLIFLDKRVNAYEVVPSQNINFENTRFKNKITCVTNSDKQTNFAMCPIDGKNHYINKCPKFLSDSIHNRRGVIAENKLCFICFGKHLAINCKRNFKCQTCGSKYHNTLIHVDYNPQVRSEIGENSAILRENEENVVTSASCSVGIRNDIKNEVLLSTAIVKILGADKRWYTARILLDSASEVSCISYKMVKRLNLTTFASNIEVQGIGARGSNLTSGVNVTIRSRFTNFEADLSCVVMNKITVPVPSQSVDISDWNIPKFINLADDYFNITNEIDILIGAGLFFSCVRPGFIKLGENKSSLYKTVFGYVVSGEVMKLNTEFSRSSNAVSKISLHAHKVKYETLNEIVAKGGFKLHKWESNCKEVLRGTPNEDLELLNPNISDDCSLKTLGLNYAPEQDYFQVITTNMEKIMYTKRGALSKIASIYDPVGFFAPTVVLLKIIMQSIWMENITWDEKLQETIIFELKKVFKNLELLRDFKIRRYYFKGDHYIKTIQICGFCDASKHAMGAVVYIRAIYGNGEDISVSFLAAKAKITFVAITKRWLYKSKNKGTKRLGRLSLMELEEAHNKIILIIQKQHFKREIECLKNMPIDEEAYVLKSSALKALNPFYCAETKKFKNSRIRKSLITRGYICIFVCLATKALHIELVNDLSTESFFAAVRRFIGRRGICESITSDNQSTFHGADRELQEIYDIFNKEYNQTKIINNFINIKIRWNFNIHLASHHVGIWEASVKSVKYHLKRSLNGAVLIFEEMSTLLIQMEAILNSRPMYALSEDISDLSYLSLGHFLIGQPMTALPEVNLLKVPANRLSAWKTAYKIKQEFWTRWHKEYLNQLQSRPKWHVKKPNLKVGALVLIKEDGLIPPQQWVLARVIKVNCSKSDGCVRSADVKTAKGIYTRPITKLCVLPMD